MKKILFWVLSPLTFTIELVAMCMWALGEFVSESLHKFEGWCYDYKSMYGGMHYKGCGVWSSIPEPDEHADVCRG